MKLVFKLRYLLLLLPLAVALAGAQNESSDNPAQVAPPVSYASVSQLNQMLTQVEQGSQAAQADLAKLRTERWKTDSGNKRQVQANVESIQRNLQEALPAMIADLRASPENLASTFKVYRNLDALYDVFGSVVESAGAFGSKDEFQTLENDLSTIEKARRSFADRMENLAGAKEAELARLRTQVRNTQAAAAAAAPAKKIVVDDTEPPKKPATKKKPASKSAKPSGSAPNPAAPSNNPSPQAK
jgi:predicted  nucleic acid-binding Zn-ribbon protein